MIKDFVCDGEMVEKDQLQIGRDTRVELQIRPSLELNFKGTEWILRLGGGIMTFSVKSKRS